MEQLSGINRSVSFAMGIAQKSSTWDAVNFQKFIEDKGFRPANDIARNVSIEAGNFHKKLLALLDFESKQKMSALGEISKTLKEIAEKLHGNKGGSSVWQNYSTQQGKANSSLAMQAAYQQISSAVQNSFQSQSANSSYSSQSESQQEVSTSAGGNIKQLSEMLNILKNTYIKPMIDIGGNVFEKVKDLKIKLMSIDTSRYRPVIEAAGNAWQKVAVLKDKLVNFGRKQVDVAINFIGNSGEKLKSIAGKLEALDKKYIETGIELAGSAGEKLKEVSKNLKDMDKRYVKTGIEFIGNAGDKLKDFGQKMGKSDNQYIRIGGEFVGNVGEKLGDIQVKLKTVDSKYIETGINFISNTGDKIVQVSNFAKDFNNKYIKTGIHIIGNAGEILNKISGGLKDMHLQTLRATLAQWGLNTALLSSPVTWTVIGIVALIAAIVLLVKNWDKVKMAMAPFFGWIKTMFTSLGDWLSHHWKKAVTTILVFMGPIGWGILALVGLIRTHWNSIKETAILVWNSISQFIRGLWDGIQENAKRIWNGIGNTISGVAEGIKGAWSSFIQWISEKFNWIKGLMAQITDNPAFKVISGGVKGAIDFGKKGISYLSDAVFGKDGPDGKHATGLSYVPFDGYIAELHKGERVMTASENRAYSNPVRTYKSNTLNSGGNVFNISINGVNKSTEEIINDLVAKISETVNTMGEVAFG